MKRFKVIITIAMVIVLLALSIPAMVSADNIQDDVVVGGNDTFTAGGSTTINYRIVANGRDGSNVNASYPATVTINTPADVTSTPLILSFTACEDGSNKNEQSVVFTSAKPGDYAITVTVTGGKPGNNGWNTAPANFTLHVLAAPPTSTPTTLTVSPATGTYGGTVTLTATLSPAVSGKSVSFTLNGGSAGSDDTDGSGIATVTDVDISGINAGTCIDCIGASFAGDSGYGASSDTADLTVDKADADIDVTPYDVTYDGDAHTATGTVKDVDDEDLDGLDLSGTTHTDAGFYKDDPWTFTDVTGNYNDDSGFVDDNIDKADADLSSISGYTGVYDGDPHGAAGTAVGVKGETLDVLDLGESFTDVPGGTADWTFTDVTGNYKDASGSVDIVISEADADLSNISGYTGVYDGDPHGATGTAVGVKGETLDVLDLGGSFTDVPGGTAHWVFTDVTGNYKDQNGDVAIIITKAPTTTTLTSSLNPSIPGWSVTFTATVSKDTSMGTLDGGKVTFWEGATKLGETTLSSGVTTATYKTSYPSTGSHEITAVYGGNTNFKGSSGSLTQNVVEPYLVGPFAPLVKIGAGVGQFKAGSTIPVKFQITAGPNGPLIIDAQGTVVIGTSTANFRWDNTAQQYIANVKAPSITNTYTVYITIKGVVTSLSWSSVKITK